MDKESTINDVLEGMKDDLGKKQLALLRQVLEDSFQHEHRQEMFTNEELIERFRQAKKFKGCKENTINFYCDTVIAMYTYVGKCVTDITAEDVSEYLMDYSDTHNVKETTINNMRRNLSAFFGFLANQQIIPLNIIVNVPSVKL